MKKAIAKLMFLSALFLINSIAWMPASAGVSSGMTAQLGVPGQPQPRPSGPTTPPPLDGANPPMCPSGSACNPSFAPK